MTKTFQDFGLPEVIVETLTHIGYDAPTPIQCEAIPAILEGKDLVGLAETGSGKTAACAIPICSQVDTKNRHIQALVIVPTRELARQYAVETQKIGKRCGVKAFALYGGEDMDIQLAKLRGGVQVLVATPGRLIDLIYQRAIDLHEVSHLVLDEADEMLSMGFYEDIIMVMECLVAKPHQTMLFSATMPQEIELLATKHMRDPLYIRLTKKKKGPSSITHHFFYSSLREKGHNLERLLKEYRPKQAIVFCKSRIQTENVSKALKKKYPKADYLHGGMGQRTRSAITDKFRSGKISILVATDVAARGLDFSGVTHVLIYDLGKDPDIYVHRTGRTGRSGREGVAVALVSDHDKEIFKGILSRLQKEPKWVGKEPKWA